MSSIARTALAASLALSTSFAARAVEVEDDDQANRLDEIVVTGSRIKRIEVEGPLPVTVIEREDFLRRGEFSLADALRDLPINTFGSAGDDPRFNSPNASVPRLRGLDSKYSLVLLDGLRLPGLAELNGGASANLNGIPLAAIDRVEVLRDGASAIYGSDAIGGVINLITRRGDVVPQVEFQIEEPQDEGGEARRAHFVTGGGNEDRSWMLAAEAQRREPLYGNQRDYLLSNTFLDGNGNPGTYVRIDPLTGQLTDPFVPDPRCPQQTDTDPVFPSSGRFTFAGREFCGYRFRDFNMERAAWDGRSVFASGRLALDDRHEAFARLQVIDGESRQQLAPAPASGIEIAEDNPINPTLGERGPGLGYPLYFNYRVTSIGPRINHVEETTLHALAGVNGALDGAHALDWSASVYHNRYDDEAKGIAGYLLADVFHEELDSGRFDPFSALPDDPGTLAAGLVHPQRAGESRATGVELGASFDASLPGGLDSSFAIGMDLRHDEYRLDSDPATYGGGTLGGFGAEQEDASRGYGALYGEMFLPFGTRWEATLAARYDHYEDAGGALSPKLAFSFRPGDQWLLRASVARGFQAPDLVSAYGPEGEGYGFYVDALACELEPDSPGACSRRPVYSLLTTNEALETEHARQGSAGILWQPSEHFDLSLDYYAIHIRDQVGRVPVEYALAAEVDCVTTPRPCDPLQDGEVVRDEFGNIDFVALPLINIAGTRTSGLDLEIGAHAATVAGDFDLSLAATWIQRYEVQVVPDGPREQVPGSFGAPEWRGSLGLDWQRGDFGASASAEYSGGFGYCYPASTEPGGVNPFCATKIPSHTELHAQVRWLAPWNAEIAFGGRNLGYREPPQSRNGFFAYGLHDPVGRVWYLRYAQSF